MEGFPFFIPYRVRVADVNYGGHVSNAAILNYFQDARIAFLAAAGSYSELNVGEGCGLIMPEAHVFYRAELFLGDELFIGVRLTNISRSSFELAYRIEREGDVAAEGSTPLVVFDYHARRPRRLGKDFRAALQRFATEETGQP